MPTTHPDETMERKGLGAGPALGASEATSRSHIKGTIPALLPPNLQCWGLTSPTPKATRPFRVTVVCWLVDMKVCPSHPHLAWIGGPGHAQLWGFLELQGHPRHGPWLSSLLQCSELRLGEGGGHPGAPMWAQTRTRSHKYIHRHTCYGHTHSPPKQASVQTQVGLHLGFRGRPVEE